ncbi:MAG TPA: tetratricopeptide repeat protein [Flavipsychrobacter sp.]|nr:tetratricopeptide repeat protein [Flavipsychrobacter sp.]
MKIRRFPYWVFVIVLVFSCKSANNNSAPTPAHVVFKEPAVAALSDKIAKDPNNAKLYYQRGMLLHRLEEDTFAIKDFQQAAALDSTKAEYFSAVGDLMFEHKDVAGSLPWIEKALSINPSDPKARLKIAKVLVFIKEYPKAFNEINVVLRQNAMNPEGYFLKGIIYKDLKDTAKAISSFQTALQVDPGHKESLIQLGSIYAAKKDGLAVNYFDNAFKLDTTDVFPLYAKGMYFQEQEKYEEAKQQYRKAIVRNHNYNAAYFAMGYILMQQDSLEKAYRQFDLVTSLEPTNAKAYYNRGLCSELLGKTDDALQDYKQALTFNEGYKEANDGVKRLSK